MNIAARRTWALDHLDDAKATYMDLFFHARPLADQMMVTMQAWLQSHRASANGMRAADIDAFDKWLQEREGIAKNHGRELASRCAARRARASVASAGSARRSWRATRHLLLERADALAQGRSAGSPLRSAGGSGSRRDSSAPENRCA